MSGIEREAVPPRREPTGYVELLRRNRNFRRVWLSQVLSQMGDWFDTVALYTMVLNLTGSGRAVGLVLVARFLPSVVVGPMSGVIADRFNRRTIMIVSDVARAVVVLGFLLVRSADQLWLVYVLTVIQLVFSTFFEPARTAAIPSLVEGRDLVTANAISSVTWSAMLTLGAAIGGLVTGWVGTDAAFILDSLTYLVSAVLIMSVRFPRRAPRGETEIDCRARTRINANARRHQLCTKSPARACSTDGQARVGCGRRYPCASGRLR